jgi:toxin ParE1/3/4
MHLRWTPKAAADLEAISGYLHTNHPSYAQRTVRTLYDAVLELRQFPSRGRIGNRPGTRELVVTGLPYIVIFRVTEISVEILRIHHGAQDWKQ